MTMDYQPLFNFLADNGFTPLEDDMNVIISIVNEMQAKVDEEETNLINEKHGIE